MKKRAFTLVCTILSSISFLTAQNEDGSSENVPRDFSIKFPLATVYAGQTIEVELITRHTLVNLGEYKIIWELSGGTITSGHETPKISVRTDENADELTVRAEVIDFAVDATRASGNIQLVKRPKAVLVKEVENFLSVNSESLAEVIQDYSNKLVQHTSAKGYIYIYPTTDNNFSRISRKIIESLKARQVDISRTKIVRKARNNNRVRLYLVPTGAEIP